ncbi:hypothetical protein HNO89_001996 [Sporosarcina luteola]|nr:hypothetical protein [Sporosarcina luteola]
MMIEPNSFSMNAKRGIGLIYFLLAVCSFPMEADLSYNDSNRPKTLGFSYEYCI